MNYDDVPVNQIPDIHVYNALALHIENLIWLSIYSGERRSARFEKLHEAQRELLSSLLRYDTVRNFFDISLDSDCNLSGISIPDGKISILINVIYHDPCFLIGSYDCNHPLVFRLAMTFKSHISLSILLTNERLMSIEQLSMLDTEY